MQFLLSYDPAVITSLKFAKREASQRDALATSVDLLIGILLQKQLTVTKILNSLGVTIESVSANDSSISSLVSDETEFRMQTCEDFVWAITNSAGSEIVFQRLGVDPAVVRKQIQSL